MFERSKTRPLSLVNRVHDHHFPIRQSSEQRLGDRVVEQGLVQRRTHDDRRASTDRLSNNRQCQIIGDAMRKLVERVEATRGKQHDPAQRPRTDGEVSVRPLELAKYRAARNQPQVALPLARVMVMWPIVVSALAPCQWRSPALT